MSDQPKPRKQDAATPTAGEWTAEYVRDILYGGSWRGIADAHNAALAEATDAAVQEMSLVKQQLAAEREKFQKAKEWNRITELEVNNLRSLLNEIDPDISRKTIAELRQQLALAVECLEWLREELKNDEYFVEKIDIAFAKVKETK